MWLTGISEQEVYVIQMPEDHEAPALAQKNHVRRIKLAVPMLGAVKANLDAKEETLAEIEADMFNRWLQCEHEIFRKQNWESLKHFRSKYDNEFLLSESILDAQGIATLKREIDKRSIEAIRVCIMENQREKIFAFLDQIHFKQSLLTSVKLCEKLKVPDLAQKINKFIQDKENKDVFLNQIPLESQPLNSTANADKSMNLQERRITPPARQVGFTDNFKSEKPNLSLVSQQPAASGEMEPKNGKQAENPFFKGLGNQNQEEPKKKNL